MPVGSAVRRLLGGLEPAAIEMYRNLFVDLDCLAATVASVVPHSKRILEIGCGDGAMAAALRRVLPDAELVGLDPGTSAPGRMYDGDRAGVEFRSIATGDLLAENPAPFGSRCCVMLRRTRRRGGRVAVKEWERRGGVGTTVAYCADRWVSGDAAVRFMPRRELEGMVARAMPGWETTCEAWIPPRRANFLVMVRRPA